MSQNWKNGRREIVFVFFFIVQCIADNHLEYDKKGKTSKEIWEKLATKFERNGVTSQLLLYKRLLALKYIDGEPMEIHLCKFDDMVRQVKSTGSKFEDVYLPVYYYCHFQNHTI